MKIGAGAAIPPKDSAMAVSAASRGGSPCVFGPAPGRPIGAVVTVYIRNDLPRMDQDTANDYATTLGLGEKAQTLTGLGVTALVMEDPPAVIARNGDYLVLVSVPSVEGTKALAMKAVARLP